MNKQMKSLVCAVMAAALFLITLCTLNYLGLQNDLHQSEKQLAESLEKWKGIAAEKEDLQADLKSKQKELKERQIYIEEKTQRADQLRNEIAQLEKEIETLKQSGVSGQ